MFVNLHNVLRLGTVADFETLQFQTNAKLNKKTNVFIKFNPLLC